jgi:polyisoprenoid-binding protein YceI
MPVSVSRSDSGRRDPVMRRGLTNEMLREGSGTVQPVSGTLYIFRELALARMGAIAGSTILLCSIFLFSLSPGRTAEASSERAIDSERSAVTVRVYKGGLFSSFGHDHEIRAPIKDGAFDEEKSTVWFVVETRSLQVLDSEASENDRAEIQATMLGPKVLDSEKFREIRFHSTEVNRHSNDQWTVHGDVTLHGQTRPVLAEVERKNGGYRGSAQLRQKDFGITPVSVAGGSVKVKDEVRIEFEIVGK